MYVSSNLWLEDVAADVDADTADELVADVGAPAGSCATEVATQSRTETPSAETRAERRRRTWSTAGSNVQGFMKLYRDGSGEAGRGAPSLQRRSSA